MGSVALTSFPSPGVALVVGASGGLGSALVEALRETGRFDRVISAGRSCELTVDLEDEGSIIRSAEELAASEIPLRLVINAAGFLHGQGHQPEKRLAELDAQHLTLSFAINTIGPALLLKHFVPLLPRKGKSVFATLSARVGSIGDNRLGGWFAYRASKAALNQIVRTAAVEIARTRPSAICIALHPGTVDTELSQPFARTGLQVQQPHEAVRRLLEVIDAAGTDATGSFLDHEGRRVPW